MSDMFNDILREMEQEAEATRKMLERVPSDKLDWSPHEKSMTLGKLARHTATIPKEMLEIFVKERMDVSEFTPTPGVESADELVPLLEESLQAARNILTGLSDDRANGVFTMTMGDQVIMEVPVTTMGIRMLTFNHWYHHRAQLGVYLRLLGVPIPSVYGPSADDNPMAGLMETADGAGEG